jgi:hypothetical protein
MECVFYIPKYKSRGITKEDSFRHAKISENVPLTFVSCPKCKQNEKEEVGENGRQHF